MWRLCWFLSLSAHLHDLVIKLLSASRGFRIDSIKMAQDKRIVIPISTRVRTKDELQRLFPKKKNSTTQLSEVFLAMSPNTARKETGAYIGTTFLSRIEPITATVPFSGTVYRATRPIIPFVSSMRSITRNMQVCCLFFQSDRVN